MSFVIKCEPIIYHYLLCNWHVRSDFEIPELLPWHGATSDPIDISIVDGDVPIRLDKAIVSSKYLSVSIDGAVWFYVENIVRFLVQNGNLVTVQLLRDDPRQCWRLFLLGSVLGYLCHQRKLFPLHAATLRINGYTIAIAGHSGAGKSTLALALTQQGHGLLSDDVTVLRISNEMIHLLPVFPRLKLWRDTLDALKIETKNLTLVRDGIEKYDLRPLKGFDSSGCFLDAILILGEKPDFYLQKLTPVIALPVISSYIFRPQVANMLNRNMDIFAQAAHISRAVPIYRLNRPKTFKDLPKSVELIETLFHRVEK